MTEQSRAVSLDLDGVLFRRPPIQAEALLRYAQPWRYNDRFVPQHPQVTPTQRVFTPRILTEREQRQLTGHAKRHVSEEGQGLVYRLHENGYAIYANTGRPSYMEELTRGRVEQAELAGFIDSILHTPDGVSSEEGKYWGLVGLREKGFTDLTHYDDNTYTVKRLSGALPDVKFVIVQDLTTGILFSEREMKKHPNVARIALHNGGPIQTILSPETMQPLPHDFRLTSD